MDAAQGLAHTPSAGDLPHHLFATRRLGLFGALRPNQLRSILSGLLLAHELNDMPADAGAVHVVGAPPLLAALETAPALRGTRCARTPNSARRSACTRSHNAGDWSRRRPHERWPAHH